MHIIEFKETLGSRYLVKFGRKADLFERLLTSIQSTTNIAVANIINSTTTLIINSL